MTQPETLPLACPNCKGECFARRDASTGMCAVHCGKPFEGSCGYRGPFASHLGEAIRLHNNICPAADWDVETAGIRHKLPKLDRA